MKYKVGDIVTIRQSLRNGEEYSGMVSVITDMLMFGGKEMTIESVDNDGCYKLKEDDCKWYWTEEMFEDEIVDYELTVKPFSSIISTGFYEVEVRHDAISPLFDTIEVKDFKTVMELLTQAKLLQEEYSRVVYRTD